MNEETNPPFPQQPDGNGSPLAEHKDSHVFGLSLRGLITLEIITGVIVLAFCKVEVKEPLYSISLIVIGSYFGSQLPKSKPPTP